MYHPLTPIPIWWVYGQSEGFPRTGYFIPAHVGAGAGQVWGVLPPALFPGRETHERRSRMWPDMGYLSGTKSL